MGAPCSGEALPEAAHGRSTQVCGSRGIHQKEVEVAPNPEMLESVVQKEHRGIPAHEICGLLAALPHGHGHAREGPGEEKRLVAHVFGRIAGTCESWSPGGPAVSAQEDGRSMTHTEEQASHGDGHGGLPGSAERQIS
jgi:hypothetical protein